MLKTTFKHILLGTIFLKVSQIVLNRRTILHFPVSIQERLAGTAASAGHGYIQQRCVLLIFIQRGNMDSMEKQESISCNTNGAGMFALCLSLTLSYCSDAHHYAVEHCVHLSDDARYCDGLSDYSYHSRPTTPPLVLYNPDGLEFSDVDEDDRNDSSRESEQVNTGPAVEDMGPLFEGCSWGPTTRYMGWAMLVSSGWIPTTPLNEEGMAEPIEVCVLVVTVNSGASNIHFPGQT